MVDKKFSKLKPGDAYKLLVCETHIGAAGANFQGEEYVYKRQANGTYIINLGYTWSKLVLAARAIAAVSDPSDVCVVASRPQAQRALLKFAVHTGATPIIGRFVPGSFTNQIQKNFKEPRLIVVADPQTDHQAIREASYVNIPVIAFTNTDSPMKYIDIAIPGNNKGNESIGLMWWLLAREVLHLRGEVISKDNDTKFDLHGKHIMPDLYFYRDPEDAKKQEALEMEEDRCELPLSPVKADVPNDNLKVEFQNIDIQDWAAVGNEEMCVQPVNTESVEPVQSVQSVNVVGSPTWAPKAALDEGW